MDGIFNSSLLSRLVCYRKSFDKFRASQFERLRAFTEFFNLNDLVK
jgi:hypothetical protein